MNDLFLNDRFLMEFRAAFVGRQCDVDLQGSHTWTGLLERVDESGLWMTDPHLTWIPWTQVESVTTPPVPEAP